MEMILLPPEDIVITSRHMFPKRTIDIKVSHRGITTDFVSLTYREGFPLSKVKESVDIFVNFQNEYSVKNIKVSKEGDIIQIILNTSEIIEFKTPWFEKKNNK